MDKASKLFNKECGLHNTYLWTRDVMACVPAQKIQLCLEWLQSQLMRLLFSSWHQY